jgi:hypothetical protein
MSLLDYCNRLSLGRTMLSLFITKVNSIRIHIMFIIYPKRYAPIIFCFAKIIGGLDVRKSDSNCHCERA